MRDTAPKKAGSTPTGIFKVLVALLLLASALALTDMGARVERSIRATAKTWWPSATAGGSGRRRAGSSVLNRGEANRSLATKPGNAPANAAPRVGGDPAQRADPPRSAKLHVNRAKSYYAVTGTRGRALWRDIQNRAPRDGSDLAVGLTSTNTRLRKTYERSQNGSCRMRRVDIYVDTEVTLPRWDAPSAAPTGLRRRWRRFADTVALHERTHERISIRAGRRLRGALGGMRASSCAALRGKAQRRTREILRQAEVRNRRFDERSPPARADLLLP